MENNKLRIFYDRYISNKYLDGLIKKALNLFVSLLQLLAGYSFPDRYTRSQRLDMILGRYEKETRLLFENIVKPGMYVIDVGAHVGYYTRILSNLVGTTGRVYAFEADEENYKLLVKNTTSCKNVQLYNIALSDKAGTIDFYRSSERSGNHSTIAGVIPCQEKTTVISKKIDDFILEENIKRVDIVKMDIEGGEPGALRGAENLCIKQNGPVLVLEFAPAWLEKAGMMSLDFLKYVRSFGYDIYLISEGSLELFSPKSEKDALDQLTPYFFGNIYCKKGKNSSSNDSV